MTLTKSFFDSTLSLSSLFALYRALLLSVIARKSLKREKSLTASKERFADKSKSKIKRVKERQEKERQRVIHASEVDSFASSLYSVSVCCVMKGLYQ